MTGGGPKPPIHRLTPKVDQSGASLITAMIILVLIALAVVSAYVISSSNLLVVGNVQRSLEAKAAGLRALEQAVSSQIQTIPALNLGDTTTAWSQPGTQLIDIDGNNQNDFQVDVTRGSCVEAVLLTQGYQAGSGTSVTLGDGYNPFIAYDTLWEFNAQVTDLLGGGASVKLTMGVRIMLTQAQLEAYCPAPS